MSEELPIEVPLSVRQGFLLRLAAFIQENRTNLDPVIAEAREAGFMDYASRLEVSLAFESSVLAELKQRYG